MNKPCGHGSCRDLGLKSLQCCRLSSAMNCKDAEVELLTHKGDG